MALSGTLQDLGVVDLVQFPYAGRKTGALVLRRDPDMEARLHYQDGELIDARTDHQVGLDALVEVISWSEGSFEFFVDSEAPERTIEIDLHRAVMMALQAQDERMQEQNQAPSEPPVPPVEQWRRVLSDFVGRQSAVQHASVLAEDGELVTEATHARCTVAGLDELRAALFGLVASYPADAFSRALIEDKGANVTVARLQQGQILMVVAGRDASMGAMARAVTKLGHALDSVVSP